MRAVPDALCVCSMLATTYLKVQVYIFVRLLPLGYRFIPRITAALAIFLVSFAFQRPPIIPSKFKPICSFLGMRTSAGLLPTLITLWINILPALFAADFVFRAHVLHSVYDLSSTLVFSRMGYVDDSSARIVFRHPFLVDSGPVRVNLSWWSTKYEDEKSWINLDVEGTFDGVVSTLIEKLLPETHYMYDTSLNHSGSFTTTRQAGKSFRFISTSCMKAFYPYNPLSHSLNIGGIRHLARYVKANPSDNRRVEWIFFLGDFIYIDLPVSFFPSYTELFQQVYASQDWTQELRDIPWLHSFDDHELVNDYYPAMDPSQSMYSVARAPFDAYQGAGNPGVRDGKTWYSFQRGPASFFVLDTRSYRARPPPKNNNDSESGKGPRTMLGKKQLRELKAWILNEKGWKVVVSGVPFTKNWCGGQDEMDSWAGYLVEREEILTLLWQVGGGVIVSGDRHEHATVKFPAPTPEGQAVIEFSTSPLSFFFQPFVREYQEHPKSDLTIYQHPHGVSKFGVFDFEEWKVVFTLVVDGEEVWSYEHVWDGSNLGSIH